METSSPRVSDNWDGQKNRRESFLKVVVYVKGKAISQPI